MYATSEIHHSIANTTYIQVNKKFCELKGRNIRIAEKAQETRPGIYISEAHEIGHWESIM